MSIKRNPKEMKNRFWMFGTLIGVCVVAASVLYFFHKEKTEAEQRLVEIVNYVKVQCSTYTHYRLQNPKVFLDRLRVLVR